MSLLLLFNQPASGGGGGTPITFTSYGPYDNVPAAGAAITSPSISYTAGQPIIVEAGSSDTLTVSDSNGLTWNKLDVSLPLFFATSGEYQYVWYAIPASSGTTAITVTRASSGSYYGFTVATYESGAGTPLLVSTGSLGNYIASATAFSNTITPTTSGSAVWTHYHTNGGAAAPAMDSGSAIYSSHVIAGNRTSFRLGKSAEPLTSSSAVTISGTTDTAFQYPQWINYEVPATSSGGGAVDGSASASLAGVSASSASASGTGTASATGILVGATLAAAAGTASGGTVVNGSASATLAGVSISAAAASGTGTASATGSMVGAVLAAAAGTASGGTVVNGSASATLAGVSISAAAASGTGTALASGTLVGATLAAASGTASGDAIVNGSASAALAGISTSAAAGSASGQRNGVATASLASVLIGVATGQGTSSSVAVGALQGWGIASATGSAYAGVQILPGALVGKRLHVDTTRPVQQGATRPPRIARTTR